MNSTKYNRHVSRACVDCHRRRDRFHPHNRSRRPRCPAAPPRCRRPIRIGASVVNSRGRASVAFCRRPRLSSMASACWLSNSTRRVGNALAGTLILPFGLALAKGATLQVDDKAVGQPQTFCTCLPGGCIVPLGGAAQGFSPWQTVYWWFRRLMRRFLFHTIHDLAVMIDRELQGREASPTAGNPITYLQMPEFQRRPVITKLLSSFSATLM